MLVITSYVPTRMQCAVDMFIVRCHISLVLTCKRPEAVPALHKLHSIQLANESFLSSFLGSRRISSSSG